MQNTRDSIEEVYEEDQEKLDGAEAYNNLQTWPKSQLSYRNLNDLNEWIQVENAIDHAKKYVKNTGDTSKFSGSNFSLNKAMKKKQTISDQQQNPTELIQTLCTMLERLRDSKPPSKIVGSKLGDSQSNLKSRRGSRMVDSMKFSQGDMGVIREEPHFESMIFCDVPLEDGISSHHELPMHHNDQHSKKPFEMGKINEPSTADLPTENFFIEQPNQYIENDPNNDPAIIRAIPHVAIVVFAWLWLMSGAWVFQQIDPVIGSKPYADSLLFTFQISTTIGWGDTSATNKFSRAFCIFYTIFSVPIVFSALANIGRLISEFYCVDWLFLTAVVRRKNFRTAQIRRRLPLRGALNLLFLHQCIGVMLYAGLLQDFGVIGAVYFSITSMATIGFGDLHPRPQTLVETVVTIIYISSGIVILSALFLSIAYYFQRMHYVILKEWLHIMYTKCSKSKKVHPAQTKAIDDDDSLKQQENAQP